MHLQHLRYLHLVVEKGSFAAAAQAAGVSQPAITMAMHRLEQEWGAVLFEKSGRQKVPTAAAVRASQHAREFLDRLERMPNLAAQPQPWGLGRDAAILKIGMAPAAALLYAPVLESVWRQHEPDGLIQILGTSAPEMLAALLGKELDLVIAPLPRRRPTAGLKHVKLHTSAPAIYSRHGHPLAEAESLSDIAEAGWGVAGRAGTAGNVIEEAHRVHKLPPPRVLIQCGDYPTLLNLVAQTDLLCVVPHPALRPPETAQRRFAVVRIREGLPLYEVCLFWSPGKTFRNPEILKAITERLTRASK